MSITHPGGTGAMGRHGYSGFEVGSTIARPAPSAPGWGHEKGPVNGIAAYRTGSDPRHPRGGVSAIEQKNPGKPEIPRGSRGALCPLHSGRPCRHRPRGRGVAPLPPPPPGAPGRAVVLRPPPPWAAAPRAPGRRPRPARPAARSPAVDASQAAVCIYAASTRLGRHSHPPSPT